MDGITSDLMLPNEAASFLPPEIQQILKRKSSRDPASRFSSKLHMLLTYVTKNPQREDDIGLCWVNENEFKMNKKILIQIMGIKLNTLNVNLRDLGFTQVMHDKDGWTQWKRSGFTRSEFNMTTKEGDVIQVASKKKRVASETVPLPVDPYVGSPFSNPIKLGTVKPDSEETFFMRAGQIWNEMFPGTSFQTPVPTNTLVSQAARRFKQQEQPLDNAQEVIQAIISPSRTIPTSTFVDLCRFLAMFGPENTIMLKIASLLSCSNNSGNWLQFDENPTMTPSYTVGYFDKNEPNCLVIKHNGITSRVWNNPLIDAFGNYLTDENNRRYVQWEEYFQQNPLRDQTLC